jgi:hypothetical protein
MQRSPAAGPAEARLEAVRLIADGGGLVCSVTRSEDGGHLYAQAEVGGVPHCGQVLCLEPYDEARRIGRELEILERDAAYEAALVVLAR